MALSSLVHVIPFAATLEIVSERIIPVLMSFMRVFFEIRESHEVGLAGRLQAGHPTPRERVAGRIGVEEMTEEKIRAEFPGQTLRVNPETRPPHPRVIVEVSGLDEFPRDFIHAGDATFSGSNGVRISQNIRRQSRAQVAHAPPPTRPHLRTHLQPALPVSAPAHFLEPFLRRRETAMRERVADHFVLGEQAMPQRWAESRDVAVASFHVVPAPRVFFHPRQIRSP